ncbi:aromatic ring-hydroxylating dioxygenase subunit alpha [Parvularcula sp. LCG005]|uniref:aromatic ring-hydroxylating dioxygenase subunit alpha n=1 Tax=Parvularcula sp. LCG005 TaxID=3078805 RepID=UPI0029438E7B|nr:aromatic ring-hydroxylating dioxygenase subunit alpha [Parvularcula sp. LCG005]WOI53656.1 aromatic ring-hydroxylating dioxygenase subunit alpha [Parvularcula sp. LCG005]
MSAPQPNPATLPLRNIWYFAAPSAEIKAGKMERRFYLGQPVVLGRTKSGRVFAMRDVCPHRAAPFSAGQQSDEQGRACVECPYHGWKFDVEDGTCRKIPALSEREVFAREKVRAPIYPTHEQKGLIWIYIPDDLRRFDGVPDLDPPHIPDDIPGPAPKMIIHAKAEGPYDEAVIGLVDPAHTPFVHQQWFWRRPGDASEKVKDYEPTAFGFRMKPHRPSSNGRAYKLIGGAATTEIEFRLPATRLETIRNEKYTILGLTCITPTEDNRALITQMFFWNMPLLSVLKPFTYPLAKTFLGQDGAILSAQNENIALAKPVMLYAGDPDRLAQWYLALKRAYLAGGADKFENPIEATQLYWRT